MRKEKLLKYLKKLTDLLEKIGKAFYKTKENGTGLGLMITYKIIEEHQGSIAIQSSMGIGTKEEIFFTDSIMC
ncbi:hypothetical protein A6279_21585 [Bacillus wiedmannii]|uniref:histidine kinase n=1 Tax=Bacillus wiedmannii TaxID=1890302 RepID=A0A1D3NRB5_9BACI|nr:hypothetical protein IEI_04720 [Bacillus wiedmannii]KAA0769647.1 sensor histidine kinase [Bacillus sp. BB51/4]MBJ8083571.1 HAMP domain-containing histidine kinase [Bacillus cereus group sp. N14]OJD46508.1 hypothetical protein BAU22_14190 [Bacillus sp. 4048]KMP24489.1 hypothetical protein TU50_25660 [Bacillus wiedmannii]